jgi:hypothetical protein
MTTDSPSPVVAILNDAKAKAKAVIKAKQAEIADIDRALAALAKPSGFTRVITPSDRAVTVVRTTIPHYRSEVSLNEGIIKAVSAGINKPTQIMEYLESVFGMKTTFGSVRSSLSTLKAKGKIDLDETGWVPAKEKLESDEPSSLFS